ncbi:MAG TPA: undecaprenyl-diphosphate phosphatase [Spirochaetia bacterium]|nr:undecaprenyl-diphosphate phosphatase [Spirochaetia bacterium]
MITYFQAVVMGLLQGVSELFPVSSLGHSVLFPTLFGWDNLVRAQSDSESFFLAFLVGLHVATAAALVIFYWDEWKRIVLGFFSSIAKGKTTTPDERLAWLLIVATIPAGLVGVVFEHTLRVLFAKPVAAALFMVANGLILFLVDRLRRRPVEAQADNSLSATVRNLEIMKYRDAGLIGVSQILALFAGISRSGITIVGGLLRGLDHKDAARFSFLLATPIILAAGVYKVPDLLGPNGQGVRSQVLVGSLVAGVAAYFAVRFLDRYFRTRTLTPFAVYCAVFGAAMGVKLLFF